MLIMTAEPAFLAPEFDSGCALPGLDSAVVPVESVLVLGVAGSEPVFGVAGLELVGPRVGSDCVPAPAVPMLLGSELVCALAGKASIAAKRGTITKLRKCVGEASRHMSRPLVAQRPTPSTLS
jgi:hypothetical protein